MMKTNNSYDWWKGTAIYQIYPRSFAGTGGSTGTIKGISGKLDYIQSLGIETVWLSPVYPSPQSDFGYDITDYRGINPEYGSMEDFEELLDSIHRRGMKLLMDMVLNHTSKHHPWFIESSGSRDNPRREWYVWKDGKNSRGKKTAEQLEIPGFRVRGGTGTRRPGSGIGPLFFPFSRILTGEIPK